MKKFFLALFLSYFSHTVFAQDIITFTDGKTVEAKVLEVTQDEIKYKKYRYQEGPLYSVNKGTVKQIKYAYGEIEEFADVYIASNGTTNNVVDNSEANTPQLIELGPDEDNAKIIRNYRYGTGSRGDLLPERRVRFKPSDIVTAKIAITESSTISNGEVEADFQRSYSYRGNLDLALKNKTNQIIYVDLANSFSTDKFESRCYYDPSKVVSVNNGRSSGGSLNLGAVAGALGIGGVIGTLASGVTLGGGKSGGTTTTFSSQRFITIPPRGSGYISECQRYNGETVKEGEDFTALLVSISVNKNALLVYNETNSPCKRDYYITYSTDPEFKTYSVLKFTIYFHQVVGASIWDISIPEGICTVSAYK
ncbi:MAG: hypothetical protein IJD53_07295 [Alistipes sp.]|nr:hypothetical protein [Alistipes sp.]